MDQKEYGALHLFFLEKTDDLFWSLPSACQQLSFLLKNWRPFIAYHSRSLGGVAHYFGISAMQKIRRSFCGGSLFVGAPVRPNMLNMLKSAAGTHAQIIPRIL